MKNQNGFTLAELVVGIALLGILGMVSAAFFLFTAKTKNQITNEIEDKVDNIIAERMILRDLKYSEPSFNNVLVRDDLGYPFFDFVYDRTMSSMNTGKRTYTLDINGKREFTFMITNERLGATIMYTPSLAYTIGNPPTNPHIASDLTFVSLNRNNEITKVNPRFWNPGVMLMLDTPAMVRQMTTAGPDYSRPARSPIFVGIVTSGGESRLTPLALPNFINRNHPLYPNETVNSEDGFLRELPPLGGAAAIVRLKAVSVVKYYLDKDSVGNHFNLYRATFDGQKFSTGQLFAAKVQKVVFSRNSVHDGVIYYGIERNR